MSSETSTRKLSNIGRDVETLIWACPCESSALHYLGLAKQALINEGRYYENPPVSTEGEPKK